jgi:hypothetical protein
MPAIVRRTASPPLCATSTEWRATSEQRSALPDTSSIDIAIRAIDSDAAAALLRLRLTGAQQLPRGAFRLLRRRVDENRRVLDRRDEIAQRLDGVVDRIGDRAGDVLGDRRLHRQVAVGEARQLASSRRMACWLRSFCSDWFSAARRDARAW